MLFQTHAAAYGAETVDFFNTTIFENWAPLSPDGNHPNGAGYDAITDIWNNAVGSLGTPARQNSIVPMLLLLLL